MAGESGLRCGRHICPRQLRRARSFAFAAEGEVGEYGGADERQADRNVIGFLKHAQPGDVFEDEDSLIYGNHGLPRYEDCYSARPVASAWTPAP
jgi:hypothetical protein